ncbi:MAG: DUF2171 domain-containing protein [Isosphaeraceae bacterium]|nr:DUF2171 domain-containing protein [Isosphaeraceae bacterium]
MGRAPRPPVIQEHMEVVDSDGVHVGIVDRVEGDYIKLIKERTGDRLHHFISLEYVTGVDDKVHLSRPRADLEEDWRKAH